MRAASKRLYYFWAADGRSFRIDAARPVARRSCRQVKIPDAVLLIRKIKDTGSALASLPMGRPEFDNASLDGVLAALPSTLKAINEVIAKGGLEGL